MPKPKWLVEAERQREHPKKAPSLCIDCIYLGKPIKQTKHRDEEVVEVYECEIHPGCLNTKYSICCDDWTPVHLV